jgi:hypothetical protein
MNAGTTSRRDWLATLLLAIFLGKFGVDPFTPGTSGWGF